MRRFVVAIAFVAVSCGSSGNATPTRALATVTRTTASPTRVAAASPSPSAAAASLRYVAIGASDTVGVGSADPRTGSWPARVAARLPAGTDYVNLGVSGSLAAQAAREQLPRALQLRPELVTVWLAVNDMNANLTPADYTAALRSVVAPLIEQTDARLFIGNVPDLRAVPAYAGADQAALGARVTAYNLAIAAVAQPFGKRAVVVDLFTGSAALTSSLTVAADGFHPSDAGYALIAERFANAIAASGIALR